MTGSDPRRTIEAVWRVEVARVVGAAMRVVRDLDLAEQVAQDALVAALEQWPVEGIPDNPGAWLVAVAQRRGVDAARRARTERRKVDELAATLRGGGSAGDDPARAAEDEVGDDVLRLMLLCCHPALSTEARAALTLRLLAGLSTAEIARAYLAEEAAIAQRIVRAKRTLAEHRADFAPGAGVSTAARIASVLEVLYLMFNEGYAGTAGDAWTRPELCDEAVRLARVLAARLPEDAEVLGLVALLELQSSRLRARVGDDGAPVLLDDQDRSRWDRLSIQRGLAALAQARVRTVTPGPFLLQAEIAACHARAAAPQHTDWPRVVALYGELLRRAPSPVVELNLAVAVGRAFGPAAALPLVDRLRGDPALDDYHLLGSVRGDLLRQLGRVAEAAQEFARAAARATNARERELLLRRARDCGGP